jgi:hypothetical protein
MRAHILASCLAVATSGGGLLGCGLFFPVVSDGPGDGGSDATGGSDGTGGDAGAADCGFTLTAVPGSVSLAAGQAASVTVQRAGGFSGEIDMSLSPPTHVTVQPTNLTLPVGATISAPFTLTADPASLLQCNLGDFQVTVQGTTTDGSCSQTFALPVHLHGTCGQLGTPGMAMLQVPGVDTLQVKAWGAGGGGGGVAGGAGGGGGYVLANVAVTPGEMLTLRVGGGGGATGGGDWAGLLRGATVLVIAGGGGGGGNGAPSMGGQCGGGSPGGGGGGPSGASGGACDVDGGNGATQTADGRQCSCDNGLGATGGLGLHNGGGGYCQSLICDQSGNMVAGGTLGGGGGGSGGSEALDAGVTLVANATAPAGGSAAGTSDVDYQPGAGVGGATGAGTPGLVVVVVP